MTASQKGKPKHLGSPLLAACSISYKLRPINVNRSDWNQMKRIKVHVGIFYKYVVSITEVAFVTILYVKPLFFKEVSFLMSNLIPI